MKKKTLALLTALVLVVCLFAGCGKEIPSGDTGSTNAGTAEMDTPQGEGNTTTTQVKIGLIVGTGGLGDQNFNDMAFNGLKDAETEYGITFDYAEPQTVSDYETYLSQFASDGIYDLIIVSTNEAGSALEKISDEFPEQQFSIVDTFVDRPNVKSILKNFAEMTFLNGYVAGAMTVDTSIDRINDVASVGIVLGKDIPNMQQGALGFTAGALLATPDTDVRVGIVGSFGDPAKAKEITSDMYSGGADIVINFAGGSGLGVINQAKEFNLYAMGGASNQNPDAPDHVIASAVEDLRGRITEEARKIIDGTWTSGKEIGGLKDAYVGITFEGSNVPIPEEILQNVEKIRGLFESGTLVLPETMEEVETWVETARKQLQ